MSAKDYESELQFSARPSGQGRGFEAASPGVAPGSASGPASGLERRGGGELPALPLAAADRAAQAHNDRLLVVGRGIAVRGRIQNCDRLIVEGMTEAVLHADEILVAPGGVFKGDALVNVARIAGRLEGRLFVRGRLEISETGVINGQVRYNQIVIREGGRISGDIQFQSIEDSSQPTVERARA